MTRKRKETERSAPPLPTGESWSAYSPIMEGKDRISCTTCMVYLATQEAIDRHVTMNHRVLNFAKPLNWDGKI